MLNDLACLRIPTMSTAGVSGVESLGDCGNEGTNGCLGASVGGVGVGCGGLRGAEVGDNWAKVVVEYKNETSSASEKDKPNCFFTILVLLDDNALEDIGKECRW